MKTFLILALSLSCVTVYAKKMHKAHVHGHAKLGVAFNGKEGSLSLETPAESIFGFEHEAKTDKDKKTKQDAIDSLKKNISSMIGFDSSLGCKIVFTKTNEAEKHAHQDGHSDFEAEFSIACEKSPKGSKLIFTIQKFFPRMKEVETTILVDDLQKSTEIKKDNTQVQL